MMTKRILILTSLLLLPFLCPAQGLSMSSDGKIVYVPTDIDARVNYPVRDFNDRLCALVKVTVVGKMEYELTLDLGTTMQFIERKDMQDIGEVWFYIPAGARRMTFKCPGYKPIEIMDVPAFQPGGVYRITITAESKGTYVTNAVAKSNYLKVKLPEGTRFSIGRTREYELSSEILSSGDFSMRLDYGEYYYRAENGLYETKEGILSVDDNSDVRMIEMIPAYSYLDIRTEPSGASVFVDGELVGTSPVSVPDKLRRGTVSVTAQKDLYYPNEINYSVPVDTKRHTVTVILSPQFGTVVCRCEDPEAELWIDNRKVGTGTWTGQLSSRSSHYLEARKEGHMSRSLNFDIVEGDTVTQTIGRPEPLYGSIEVLSEPSGAVVKVDGKQVGTTPFILNEVFIGNHRIELSKDGYELYAADFTLEHNQYLPLNYTLKKNEVKATAPRQEATANMEAGTLSGYEWVDLGLSVLWATCNVGASSPFDNGNCYAWGETTTNSSYTGDNSRTYEKRMGDISGNTRYDAATANWGSGWRMPTREEFEELVYKCAWEWTSQGGRNGYKVTGPNGNSIFLPVTGWCYGTSLNYAGDGGYYWCSTPHGSSAQNACHLYFYSDYYTVDWGYRYYGHGVRPVLDK